ncbi:hypothetical protein LIER_10199 [Lithospermum erythrorhizon]|uniref:Uncharacterized protein n=1 Tax=Lithospermum erythrorhizon TaxID=34254 RepID=A0AAV3PME5_LITER
MDEQRISHEFLDRLNPALYDQRVYVRECPYSKAESPVPRAEYVATQSSSSSGESDTTSASSPISQVAVGNSDASKTAPCNDDVRVSVPIKDKMSHSLENQDNFELRPRTGAYQTEASISGEMPLLSVTNQPAAGETRQPLDPMVVATRWPTNTVDPALVMRANAAHQCIIYSLPTLLKESMPPP